MRRSEISSNTLASDAISGNLQQEVPTWRKSFDALLARVQVKSEQYSSDEIEADITAAVEEVKALRRALVNPEWGGDIEK